MNEKIKIGLIEPALHVEVLRNYAFIFSSLNIEVHAVLTKSAHELMRSIPKNQNLNWHFWGPQNSIKEILNNCNLIIFTTFDDRITSFLDLRPPKYAVVHALHQTFEPWKHFDFRIKPLRSTINLIRSLFSNTPSLGAVNGFIVGAPTVFEYLKKQSYFQDYSFYDFPFYLSESTVHAKRLKKGSLKIVIPGSVHPSTRNYQMIYELITKLNYANRQVEIILAGKASGKAGKEIIQKMNAIQIQNLTIKCFSNFLSAGKYQQIMEDADILLCPIPTQTVSNFTIEKNSYSHVSGNINDFVNYDKAIILPMSYQLESGLESAVLRYKDPIQLQSILEDLISGDQSIPNTATLHLSFGLAARIPHFRKELDRLLTN